MRLVVTSQGPDPASQVDPRFGRAKYFLVADLETGRITARDNSGNLDSGQGAGVQASRDIAELGAGALVTGSVGPKAFAILQEAGISVHTGATGTVQEAIEQFKAGRLQQADGPNHGGHRA